MNYGTHNGKHGVQHTLKALMDYFKVEVRYNAKTQQYLVTKKEDK